MGSTRNLPVLMVVSEFPSLSQTFISLQIAELVHAGEEVVILNLGRTGRPEWAPEPLRKVLDRITVIGDPRRTRVRVRGSFSQIGAFFLLWSRSPRLMLRFLGRTLLRLRLIRYLEGLSDAALAVRVPPHRLVHCQFATLAHRIVQLRQLRLLDGNAPLLCSARGYDITTRGSLRDTDWPEVCRQTRMFLPVCRFFEPMIRELGFSGEVRVVPSPVNLDLLNRFAQKQRDPAGRVSIISVGRLVEKKGFADGIKAVSALLKRGFDLEYRIVGDGPQRAELDALIKASGATDRIHLTGPLPSDRTLALMAECSVLLAPCRTAENGDSEGIPNVLKEAMALGLQVVATDHAGIPELVIPGETGILVPEKDTEVLIQALGGLLEDRSGWAARADKGRRFIQKNYSPAGSVALLRDCYRAAVQDPA